jgi:hypothetical protein
MPLSHPWPWDLIVVTGVDQVGKSTVARILGQRGHHVVHCPYRPDISDLYAHHRRLLLDTPHQTVFDRSFISEHVYGPVLRGHSRLTEQQFLDLLTLLASRTGIVLYLYEREALLHDRLTASAPGNPGHHTIAEHVSTLLSKYEAVLEVVQTRVPVRRLEPSACPISRLETFIDAALRAPWSAL